jgi:multicomponent Na+:H+ antiporter subunit G
MLDTYGQLHAQGLATGSGVMAVLASSVATENAAIITFAVLAIAFIALTSPVSGHAIARAAYRRDSGKG